MIPKNEVTPPAPATAPATKSEYPLKDTAKYSIPAEHVPPSAPATQSEYPFEGTADSADSANN